MPWAFAPIGAFAAVVVFAYAAPLAPLAVRAGAPGTAVLDANGTIIARDAGEGLRIPVPLEDVAPAMIAATIAAEDRRFFVHPGFDPLAMARAAVTLRTSPSGASTITQQLARRLYIDGDPPLALRKARELLVAVRLETRYSKHELLAAYLNDVYYGRGAYGVEAAARVYFGVPAAALTLAQASYLAGLPQLPAHYAAPDAGAPARERQRYVLDRMVATGAIAPDEAVAARLAELRPLADTTAPVAPQFMQLVREELARVAPSLAGRRDLVVETTLHGALQGAAERAVAVRLGQLARHEAGNAAVVVLDPASGAVLAYVGNGHPDDPAVGAVDLARAARQPGSALKPVLYAAALERGFTAATPLLDVPTSFDTASGAYAPSNYDLRFRGPVPLRVALASSLNVPAVRTLDAVGVDGFLAMARRFGLRTLDASEAYGLALALGGGDVRLLDLSAAYATLAAGGLRVEPFTIRRVRDGTGSVLYAHAMPAPVRVLSAQDAFVLSDILSDPIAREPGFGAGSILETPFDAAVKTGTSSQFRDNWTLGYTPDRVVGVWVGNPDGAPMVDISGVDGAGPIWRDVIDAAVEGRPRASFVPPEGLVRSRVCARTGRLPGPDCPTTVIEWFAAGAAPTATEQVYAAAVAGRAAVQPPSDARAWSIDAGLQLASAAPRGAGTALPPDARAARVVTPASGRVFFLASELPGQQLWLRASVPPGAQRTRFVIDGVAVAAVAGEDPRALWRLTRGQHQLRIEVLLADDDTITAQSRFEVR